MILSKLNKPILAKALLAIVLLSLLVGVAGSQLAPKMPLHLVLFYSAVGVTALFVVLVLAVVVTLTFAQFILRMGGTDPQWFWFSAEPPGLVHLREQACEAQSQATRSDE